MPGLICCAVMLDHFLPLCAEHPKDKGFYSVSLLPFLTKEGKLAFHLKSSKARLPNRRCMIRHREIYRSTKPGSKTHQEETYICQLTYRPCQHALIQGKSSFKYTLWKRCCLWRGTGKGGVQMILAHRAKCD